MPDVIAIGSIGLDTVKTPFGSVKDEFSGTAVFSSVASSIFSPTGIVSIAGTDIPKKHFSFLKKRGICTKGIQIVNGKTLRFSCFYEYDMNEAHVLKTEVNVFENFSPVLPEDYRKARHFFIGSVNPKIQLNVIKQLENPEFVVIDTKPFWIEKSKKTILDTIKNCNLLLINEWEARQLFGTPNLVKAAKSALKLGPEYVIIKKGEHGSLLFTDGTYFSAPSYPLETLIDPTGAGDSYAGAMVGWLAKNGNPTEKKLRKAMIYGAVVASFTVEGFGLSRLKSITLKDIENRYSEIKKFVCF
ncbi:MAG: PfkB family carbohydrate kinase [Candidatus Aenigmarchaeota archaeon]|nr:PfkB family carbohydrate kinase [Candidatus Aenigmarchaeota archaeon]